MSRQKLTLFVVLVAAAASVVALVTPMPESYVYSPSDITKANPDLVMGTGTHYMLQDIEKTKNTVVLTLSGRVLSVGDLVDWEYEGDRHGAVPVTIRVEEVAKIQADATRNVQRGDLFTFYLGGIYEMNQHYIDNFEPQFEVGEEVVVHVGRANQGPKGHDGDNYFVELGMYGKYRIVEGKAYNENYPAGKSLQDVYDEAK